MESERGRLAVEWNGMCRIAWAREKLSEKVEGPFINLSFQFQQEEGSGYLKIDEDINVGS